MAGFTYSTLTTAILNYTEVGTSVLSSTITDQFIDNSELLKIIFTHLQELYLLEDYKFIHQQRQQQVLIVG
jgi:hypothetical protein